MFECVPSNLSELIFILVFVTHVHTTYLDYSCSTTSTTSKFSRYLGISVLNLVPALKLVPVHGSSGTQLYERMRKWMVISTRRQMFILFLGHNSFTYESCCFSMYYSLYYCNIHTYYFDESTV